jgi:hypothetical protein
MRDRASLTLSIGVLLVIVRLSLPSVLKLMRFLGIFEGPWDGFGLFVINLYLRPWLPGSGLLLMVLGERPNTGTGGPDIENKKKC